MNKQKYLTQTDVAAFIEFLANIISGELPLKHKYFDRKLRKDIEFNSLYCGFDKYHWNGADYHTNKAEIDVLVENFQNASSKSSFFQACKDTLYWGAGNTDKLKLYTSNKAWLDGLDDVQQNITEALDLLIDDNLDVSDFGTKYRSNAGFTKIYAFIKTDSFIIYDSRVAAALAYLILLFCQNTQRTEIPDYLQITLAKGQGNSNRLPQINDTALSFKVWGSKHETHAKSNVWANWLITEAFNKAKCNRNNQFKNVREIEAALFMIGYDFPLLVPKKNAAKPTVRVTVKTSKKKVTADQVRVFTLGLINEALESTSTFEFTSSDIRGMLGGDLTAICGALKRFAFFSEHGIALEVINAPKSGLGKVSYKARKVSGQK